MAEDKSEGASAEAEPEKSASEPAQSEGAAAQEKPAEEQPKAEKKKQDKTFPYARGVADLAIDKITRRGFVSAMAGGWMCMVTGLTTFLMSMGRFMYPNVLYEPPTRFKVGSPEDYPMNNVETKWKQKYGVWIGRSDQPGENGGLYALISVCTHLGCPPNWLSAENKFKCPCHGSGFRITGVNFEGPAPRPLERAWIGIDPDDGQIVVDKSKKYQKELGQWALPGAHISNDQL